MQRFTAAVLWAGPARVFAPGQLIVDSAGIVRDVGPFRGARPQFQGLIPGLVNAHVHAEIPRLERAVRRFVPWARAVMAARYASSSDAGPRVARHNLKRLLARGCTAIGDVDSTSASADAIRDLGLAGRRYVEFVGFDVGPRRAARVVAQRAVSGSRRCPRGLSPHAPYSVSPALLRACVRTRSPLMVHVAETPEEVEFLQAGRGPFRELLEQLGKLPRGFRGYGHGAVSWLQRNGALSERTTLVHCQHLEAEDEVRIRAAGASIVICPGTIEYFRRSPPPVSSWLAAGITVGLGTDSLASNESGLDMLSELAVARRLFSEVDPAALLAMATRGAARALRRPGLGHLRRGSPADFVTLRWRGRTSSERLVDAVTSDCAKVLDVYRQGRCISQIPALGAP